MAKVTGPLFSVDAHGTIAKALTYSTRGVHHYARLKAHPPQHTHPFTIDIRNAMRSAHQLWNHMTEPQRADWNTYAAELGIPRFAAFCKVGWENTHSRRSYSLVSPRPYAMVLPEAPEALCCTIQEGTTTISTVPGARGWATLLQWNDSAQVPAPPTRTIATIHNSEEEYAWRNPDPRATHLFARSVNPDGSLSLHAPSQLVTASWKTPPFKYWTCGSIHHVEWYHVANYADVYIMDYRHGGAAGVWWARGKLAYSTLEPWVHYIGDLECSPEPFGPEPNFQRHDIGWHQTDRWWSIHSAVTGEDYFAYSKHPCRLASHVVFKPADPPGTSPEQLWAITIRPSLSA